MCASSVEFKIEKRKILKLFLITLSLMVVCAVVIILGVRFHNVNIFSFFGVVEGLLFGFMILIAAEEIEIINMQK